MINNGARTKTMKKQKHRNYLISSNLIFASAVLGIISFFLIYLLANDSKNIMNGIFSILFIVGLGLLVRIGKKWVKFLLLALTIFGLFLMTSIADTLAHNLYGGIIAILQTVLQIVAVILLFLIPKDLTENE
jgi:hypothetical protein